MVDGYSEEGCSFSLTLTSLPMPPPVTFCDAVEPITDYIFGNTCDGYSLITSLACNEVPEEGFKLLLRDHAAGG